MIFRPIDSKDFDQGMSIGGYSSLSEYNKAKEMFQYHPDLFVGCYKDDRLIGICYGWPEYIHRWNKLSIQLSIISMIPTLRKKGYGTQLMHFWENQVKKRGNCLISLGSGADGFYLKNNYIPLEYCFKTYKWEIPKNYTTLAPLSHVKYSEDPLIVMYINSNRQYNYEYINEMKGILHATDGCTIFIKEV